LWKRAWLAPLGLAIAGGLLAVLTADADRLGYAYLFGLFTTATFMLGALFLVLVQFLTASYWGVSSRRIVEVIMSGAPVVALLALPFIAGVALGKIHIYDEWQSVSAHGEHGDSESNAHHEGDQPEHGVLGLGSSVAYAQADAEDHGEQSEAAAHDEAHSHTSQEATLHHEILEKKAGYLNTTGWVARGLGYLLVWCLLALAYFGWSRRQDQDHDPKHTVRMQSLAAPSLILFAGALTFAAFDWLMSLEAAWFSTIFGVIIFAGSAVAILALTILIGLSLYKRGLVGDVINIEHFHDLSRLMFGFVCFWTYVQFSQWMLIWYAGIPEEATWFMKRWDGGWKFVSYLLIFGHFVAPFVLLISRVQKRALPWLQVMCFWVLFMHIVDIYWFVLPQAGAFHVQLADVGALLFVGGVFFAYVFWQLGKVPLVPVGDPRLQRSHHLHQIY
jgi:ABC-type multidrug transport system fused ATPase/permease subunit